MSDWERCNAFYRDVIGAEIVPVGGGFAYRLPNGQLNLHGPGHMGMPRAARPVEPGNSDLCFAWNGPIAEAIAHLERRDVAVELGPVERFGARGKGDQRLLPRSGRLADGVHLLRLTRGLAGRAPS